MPPPRRPRGRASALLLAALALSSPGSAAPPGPFHTHREIFAPESWHVHGSSVVELPGGDLLACWFHGSGERKADDVKVEGARLRRGAAAWSPRFTLADTPGFPDCNPSLLLDPRGQLWLFWVTILANQWESALTRYQFSTDYHGDGSPRWSRPEVLLLKPPPEFETATLAYYDQSERAALAAAADDAARAKLREYHATVRARARDRLAQRLGWMPRAHPFVHEGRRLIVPLYSDGFDFSLMALSDDWGATWRPSTPLHGAGNIQPSIARRRDGRLFTLMRDNGPAPKRLHQSESRDGGETWSPVTDSDLPNPGSGAEIVTLRDGRWAFIGNDTEEGRHRLVVMLSEDEGRSWAHRRALEDDPAGPAGGRYHYPSLIEAADGTFHATYSHHVRGSGGEERKTIRHAQFNAAWVRAAAGR